jgi:hypothetical protein
LFNQKNELKYFDEEQARSFVEYATSQIKSDLISKKVFNSFQNQE